MNAPFVIQGLIDQGYSYLGMINEAKSKCLILKDKIQSENLCESDHDFSVELDKRLKQINQDIHKYSEKLMNICEQLRKNGALC